MAASLAPCQLVVRRTFAERADRPDFVSEAWRSRAFSDSFALSRSADVDEADCKEVVHLSDAETDVDSRGGSSPSQPAAESDTESQESARDTRATPPLSFPAYPQTPATCWVAVTVAPVCPQPQTSQAPKSRRAIRSQRILPRPVLPTPDVENDVHKTTVMLRNMPNNYTRALLVELLDREGFACQYDFVYLPIDFESRACKGYAFINLRDSTTALRFFRVFTGFSKWTTPSRKVSGVSWSGTQGLQTYIACYRNSSIMSASTPDEYKPAIFDNGVRVPFPAVQRGSGRA